MYEMWCFLKNCRIILSEYKLVTNGWNYIFGDKVVFPFLYEGTKLEFEKNKENLTLLLRDLKLPIQRNGKNL